MAFPPCVWSYVLQYHLQLRMPYNKIYIDVFFSTVYQHMSYKITISEESPAKTHAIMLLLPTVYFDMSNKITISGKSPVKICAMLWLLTTVYLICLFKIKILLKRLATMNAYIGLYSNELLVFTWKPFSQ